MKITLNLGAGKVDPDKIQKFKAKKEEVLILVDRSYKHFVSIEDIESYIDNPDKDFSSTVYYCNLDILSFLNSFKYKVDRITCSRVLEHIPIRDIPYLLFLLYQVCKEAGELEIIVPDHSFYAERLLMLDKEIVKNPNYPGKKLYNELLTITTEFCNEPDDPHMSIWSENLAKFYLELEGLWKITGLDNSIQLEGRPYLSIKASPTNQNRLECNANKESVT